MMTIKDSLYPVILAALTAIPALAQNYDAMLQQQLDLSNQMAAQMQQMEQGMVQRNLQDPQVQAMYQQHLQQGGQMTPEQFAYGYAATGGYSPEGKMRFRQNETNNQRREMDAYQGYRGAQDERAEAMQGMFDQNARMAHSRGNILEGTTDYVDPNTGQRYNLSHTAPGNTFAQEPGSGQQFYQDPQGNYYAQNPDQSWQGLEEAD